MVVVVEISLSSKSIKIPLSSFNKFMHIFGAPCDESDVEAPSLPYTGAGGAVVAGFQSICTILNHVVFWVTVLPREMYLLIWVNFLLLHPKDQLGG